MKISTKGRYGLRILLDIALYRVGDRPRMIREIANNQEISEKYISRLIIELRKAGLVKSDRKSTRLNSSHRSLSRMPSSA